VSARPERRQRLSWQLWTSHLTVVVITLVALVGALVSLSGAWLLRQGFVLREPAVDAQLVAGTIGNLLRRGADEARLSAILTELQSGGLQLPVGPFEGDHGPWMANGPPALRPDLRDADFLVVVGPDGRLLASSDPNRLAPGANVAFAGAEEVLRRAQAGERDTARLSAPLGNGGTIGAYPVFSTPGGSGKPLAVVVLAKRTLPPRDPPHLLGRALAAFGLVTTLVLTFSSIFALTFSGLAAYLLARRLSGRLERLSQAADAIAHGDLARRVEPGRRDEVGQLGEHFNAMADRLRATIAALEVEKARAEQALRTRRELMANVSHELRTPLALIRGHVESLAMGTGPRRTAAGAEVSEASGEQAEYLPVIEREVERLERLIDDLFALATAEAGQLPLTLEPLRLEAVAAELTEALAPIARRERQVTLINAIERELPPVQADRQRLSQVLSNLLRNALRYTPAGGLISLSARPLGDQLEVSVADTGLGIPPEMLPHVFERFYRGDPSRDRASGGAGLGLAIVRELVEAMGGQVGVESVPDEGSRFWFTLPRAAGTDLRGSDRRRPLETRSQ
jgi:signal transduction histidine kinase